MQKTNIVIIGFAGCGKSSTGKLLAKRLDYSFIDTDTEIENKMQMSIPEIFEIHGEGYFRSLESEIAKKTAAEKNFIISCGGGLIKNPENVEALKQSGLILYLKSSPEKIYSNVKYDNSRPLLAVPDKLGKIKELLSERQPLYEKYGDIIIDTSNLTVTESVNEMEIAVKKALIKP